MASSSFSSTTIRRRHCLPLPLLLVGRLVVAVLFVTTTTTTSPPLLLAAVEAFGLGGGRSTTSLSIVRRVGRLRLLRRTSSTTTTTTANNREATTTSIIIPLLRSTPFDIDMYSPSSSSSSSSSSPLSSSGDDDDEGGGTSSGSGRNRKLVLGINKYSHDASICAADANTGEVLFGTSKERHTRKKNDGGETSYLVEMCLEELDANLEDVVKVVMNNHHHRILSYVEKDARRVEWEVGMMINYGSGSGGGGGGDDGGGYADEYNLLSSIEHKFELSHHLAHAYSVASQCPFDDGMIVVMDGMGETYRTMRKAIRDDDVTYVSDLTLISSNGGGGGGDDDEKNGRIQFVPSDIEERAMYGIYDWREAESVYTFVRDREANSLVVKPVFKRFTEENSPPALYNHGFENMDSVGAVYSRASSHIFGDWNACGKVMGLAPWQGHSWDIGDIIENENGDGVESKEGRHASATTIDESILEGKLYEDYARDDDDGDGGGLRINRSRMMGLPLIARLDPDMFDDEGNMIRDRRYDFDDNDYVPPGGDDNGDGDARRPSKQHPTTVALDAIGLASRVQADLEYVCLDFVRHFKERTGERRLCLAGGVALNSVLNGRLSRELGFEETFVPPYPGDDGIAVGCCAFGLFGGKTREDGTAASSDMPRLWETPLSPYLGRIPTLSSMKEAIEWASPWLDVDSVTDESERNNLIVDELVSGGVVAIYNGRSELGPRALGHRSILADPRKKGLVRFINEFVKKRESFRPFAPSCLAEEAAEWFDLGDRAGRDDDNVSPYMSITAQVKESKRELIPAVTHVDGSSRLQTVTSSAEPHYHRLISAFYKATGVPMVLNTSFNTLKGEPIVETPRDAIRSFLSSMGTIEMLVMGDFVIKRREADVRKLLGEEKKGGAVTAPSLPRRAGSVNYKTTFSVGVGGDDDGDYEPSENSRTLVQMPDRPMHNDKDGGWFELLDDLEGQLLGICDGTVGVNDMMTQFTAMSEDENYDKITEADQFLLENIIRRLVRLYEHTLISW